MTDGQRAHEAVLADEIVRYLAVPGAGRFLDGTVGLGGHAARLLEAVPGGEVLGIDRDADAVRLAAERLAGYGSRARVVQGCYSEMKALAAAAGWQRLDGILLDLGVSSPQIDRPDRGFSFRFDGPLDMRMDRRSRITAATLLNRTSEEELANIFYRYGEERRSRRIAAAVVARRQERPWERTLEFAELVTSIVGRGGTRGLPPATRCFQALRIAVNDELGELERGLAAAMALLRPGGRLAVISFHSLEDRMVKQYFREEAADCVCPPGLPECVCGKRVALRILTRKPVTASPEELSRNRRSASAKLRVAEKTAGDGKSGEGRK